MLEQLSKQLQKQAPQAGSVYSRMGLSLVIFSIYMSYFLYHQVSTQVSFLTYRDSIASAVEISSQQSLLHLP